MSKINAARLAIKQAGGQAELARKLSAIRPDLPEDKVLWRIQKWFYNGVPPEFVATVSDLSGVSRHELSPTVFPDPNKP